MCLFGTTIVPLPCQKRLPNASEPSGPDSDGSYVRGADELCAACEDDAVKTEAAVVLDVGGCVHRNKSK